MDRDDTRHHRARVSAVIVVALLSSGLAARGGSSGANGPTYKLQVTVESIKKGSLKDFNGIQLNANEKASTPYYPTVRITKVGPTSLNTSSNDPGISVEGVDDTGNPDTSVTFFGTFPPCPDADTHNPLRARQSFRTCLTYLVPGGITKVA